MVAAQRGGVLFVGGEHLLTFEVTQNQNRELQWNLKKEKNKIQKALWKQVVLASDGHRATLDKQMSANKSQREDGVYAAEQEMRAAAVWSSGCAQGLPG